MGWGSFDGEEQRRAVFCFLTAHQGPRCEEETSWGIFPGDFVGKTRGRKKGEGIFFWGGRRSERSIMLPPSSLLFSV